MNHINRWIPIFAAIALGALAQHSRAQSRLMLDADYLDALRAEVRTNHPAIAAAQARLLAAEAGVRAVRLWEDPMAGFGVMAAEIEMRREDGDLIFSAEQMLPRRKLYQARKTRASAEHAMFQAESRSATLTLESLVAQTAIELALADEMLAIESEQLAWLESMAANARDKLKDPTGNASEPLRIESEVAKERQRIDSTERTRERLARELDILLGRPAEGIWPARRLPEAASLTPALAGELSRLARENPMLEALLYSAAAARAELEVARRERSPVFSIGVDSSVYSGGDFRQATIGAKMTLPWFNDSVYRAATERARQQQVAAERDFEALERRLRREAIAAHTDAENAAHQAEAYAKDVIPRAAKAAESTRIAWISSMASLLEVLEAQRALLEDRIEERGFVAAHRAALETLRALVPPPTQP